MPHNRPDQVRDGLEPLLPRLWRFAFFLCGARDVAEDLVQATCLRALERAQQFQPDTRLDRWLFAILRSVWFNELRSRRVRSGEGAVDAQTVLFVDGVARAEMNIFGRQVLAAIGSLPPAQRETALLVYGEGYSYKEAASLTGVPIGTVMSRLAAARVALAPLGVAAKNEKD
ncbi:MAG TPA: RNA polymerase sigma factor [Roseiarcus sp.]|nr:RNA polymerase sigma factor [Roseiarcus sp.]